MFISIWLAATNFNFPSFRFQRRHLNGRKVGQPEDELRLQLDVRHPHDGLPVRQGQLGHPPEDHRMPHGSQRRPL